jgi:hypothetical protein|tara:strand:- start:386 stop:517 length:132 start_codon:yes stop_codon:yes gene_type:complete
MKTGIINPKYAKSFSIVKSTPARNQNIRIRKRNVPNKTQIGLI